MSWFGFAEEEAEEDPNQKRLVVELYGGREITDPKTRARKEGPQFCDVFCTLRLGNIKYQTEIIKTSMNPVWQTSFEFPIDNCLDSAVIEISCYHSGMVTNTFLGEVRIPVTEHRDMAYAYAQQHWFPLFNPKHRKKDGGAGELGIKIGAQGGDVPMERTDEYGTVIDDRTAEDIYEEANMVAMEGNKSAQRSLRLAEQTRDIQANTIMKLKDQGHQIERMQGDMDTIHNNMKQSERKLRSIESVWGSFANKVTSNRNSNYKKKAHQDRKIMKKRKTEEHKNKKIKEAQWEEKRTADRKNSRKKRDNMIQRDPGARGVEVGSQEEQFYAIIDDTDQQLDQLVGVLDDIKGISLDMGVELNEQNDRLDALRHDVDKAAPRMDSAIKRSRAILKA
mmetsp:Transcript_106500/g.159315  ORF Transcript_106500/g.159315 Transcript_106500/m.159315 type:complete len:393 (-) Transcript_106500:87-1265(-)